MKIKGGFITNSSSTSYVVYLPDGLELPDDLIQKAFDEWYGGDEEIDDFKEDMINAFKILKDGSTVTQWDEGSAVFHCLGEIFLKHDLVIDSYDGASDDGSIRNINSKTINDKIEKAKKVKWGQ